MKSIILTFLIAAIFVAIGLYLVKHKGIKPIRASFPGTGNPW